MATERKCEIGGIVKAAEIKPGFQVLRVYMGHIGSEGDISKANRFICSFYSEFTTCKFNIISTGFQAISCYFLTLLYNFFNTFTIAEPPTAMLLEP